MIQLEKELHANLKPSFQIIAVSDHQFDITFQVPAELTYFKGHFPSFPVLPAVGLLDITSFFVIKAFNLKTKTNLDQVMQLKISVGVQPLQETLIQLTRQSDSTYKALWSLPDKSKLAELTFSYLIQPT